MHQVWGKRVWERMWVFETVVFRVMKQVSIPSVFRNNPRMLTRVYSKNNRWLMVRVSVRCRLLIKVYKIQYRCRRRRYRKTQQSKMISQFNYQQHKKKIKQCNIIQKHEKWASKGVNNQPKRTIFDIKPSKKALLLTTQIQFNRKIIQMSSRYNTTIKFNKQPSHKTRLGMTRRYSWRGN